MGVASFAEDLQFLAGGSLVIVHPRCHRRLTPFGVTPIGVIRYRGSMKRNLRNVTITIEEDVARWARLEAARADTSVSRLLAGMLKERMLQDDSYKRAMRRSLARKPFLSIDGRYLSREEPHERANLS